MTTTLTLTSVIIGLFIIHTILTHLLNWFVREDDNIVLSFTCNIIELIIMIIIIINITS